RRSREQHRLAVLPRYFDIGGAKAAQTVLALPAIERADDKLLPVLQHEGFTGPFAGRVAQMTEEVDRMTRGLTIPDQPAFGTGFQVRQMPFAGQFHQVTGNDLAADHRTSIG